MLAVDSGRNQGIAGRESGNDAGPDNLAPDNNALHTEPRAARVFLLASRSPRPGERCRYHSFMLDCA